MHAGRDFKVDEVGFNQMKLNPRKQLVAIICGELFLFGDGSARSNNDRPSDFDCGVSIPARQPCLHLLL